jgi:monoamine oxidase
MSYTSFSGHACDVIVIGAGAAGLAATRMLQHEGCEVLTLEARDRLGGRILTDWTFASYPVELGAEFIHGKNVHVAGAFCA